MTEGANFEISDDGKTASASFELAAYGDYEEEKQLSSQQIIDLKELIKNQRDVMLSTIATRAVARIAVRLAIESAFWDPEAKDGEEISLETIEAMDQDEPVEGMKVKDLMEIIDMSANMAASWQEGFDDAMNLPGDEWPYGMTPPATYVEPLKSDELIEEYTSFYSHNYSEHTEWVTEQVRLFESVTGIRLDVKGLED